MGASEKQKLGDISINPFLGVIPSFLTLGDILTELNKGFQLFPSGITPEDIPILFSYGEPVFSVKHLGVSFLGIHTNQQDMVFTIIPG